jgi:glycosyltransferase involved in cell wall biosynthesis
MPKVSVIIPCYNQGDYVDDAVNSVLEQTFQDFEIIIVNDGSDDEVTINKLTLYNRPKTRVIHTPNLGLAAARNNGIRTSSGEYILPLDADDKIADTYLEKALNILANRFEIGAVTTNQVIYFGAMKGLEGNAREGGSELFIGHFNNQVSCSLFRRADWEACGGYDETMKHGFEDWEFWLRLTGTGLKVATIKEPLFFYRIKEASMWSESEMIKPQLIKYMIEKHTPIFQKYISEAIVNREEIILGLRAEIKNLRKKVEGYEKHFQSRTYKVYLKIVTTVKNLFGLK